MCKCIILNLASSRWPIISCKIFIQMWRIFIHHISYMYWNIKHAEKASFLIGWDKRKNNIINGEVWCLTAYEKWWYMWRQIRPADEPIYRLPIPVSLSISRSIYYFFFRFRALLLASIQNNFFYVVISVHVPFVALFYQLGVNYWNANVNNLVCLLSFLSFFLYNSVSSYFCH